MLINSHRGRSSARCISRVTDDAVCDSSREFATELGITFASDLEDFKYPTVFPPPPESLNHLSPSDNGDAGGDDDMSNVFSPRRNEFIWFFYLAEISLRRTLDEILSVVYEKGEQRWLENIDLVYRQYYDSEKQLTDWCVYGLPCLISHLVFQKLTIPLGNHTSLRLCATIPHPGRITRWAIISKADLKSGTNVSSDPWYTTACIARRRHHCRPPSWP